jgi:hypothetical protein
MRGRGWILIASVLWAAAGVLLRCPLAEAQTCRLLQYAFEPDCFERGAAGSCRFDAAHPDLGTQVAAWIESADGTAFVDTLMATNAVALHGIGNRPGRWDMRSGPRFPYGRRPMALPVWAHRRGILYDAIVMDDGRDDWMSFHEAASSPETYFCRPMMQTEIVDAVTCASGTFHSVKGIFDRSMPQSYYPPRGDLIDWGSVCIPPLSGGQPGCDFGDARQFGIIDDLDAIATATPAYDQVFSGTWTIPSSLADGDYAFFLEVNKEFDSNSSFSHPSFINPDEVANYNAYGQSGNVGQPSVVYRLPFHLSAAPIAATVATSAAGYGDWTGLSGDTTPIDDHLSTQPGSGLGRLRVSDGPGGPARVHLVGAPCAPLDCATAAPPDAPRVDEPTAVQAATTAAFSFQQSSDNGAAVIGYELRYVIPSASFMAGSAVKPTAYGTPYSSFTIDESTFSRWTPAPAPAVTAPGAETAVSLSDLLPQSEYAVGLRAKGACGWSATSFIRVHTGAMPYAKLSGCVIATAAYGSDLDPDVALLRRERDWAAERSGLVTLAALLYARSAPPLADLLRRSDTARAGVRSLLRPAISANRALSVLSAGMTSRQRGSSAPSPPGSTSIGKARQDRRSF